MRIKLDENLPDALMPVLEALGHDVDSVPEEKMQGRDDDAVWEASQQAQRFLMTQDLDCSSALKYVPGTHHGILLVRLRDPGRLALLEIVKRLFETEPVETWRGCLAVVTERKLRVLRPPEQEE